MLRDTEIKSLMPYVGSKALVINNILEHFPSTIKEYREPMIGGGSIFIGAIEEGRIPKDTKIKLGDRNKLIYDIWNICINYPEVAIRVVDEMKLSLESHFEWESLFGEKLDFEDWIIEQEVNGRANRAMCELIMCKLRRYGNFGEIREASIDKLKADIDTPIESIKRKIEQISNSLQHREIEILNSDYEWSLINGDKDTLVVLDPPYLDVKTDEEYYEGNHFDFDYERFSQLLKNTPCKFIVTCDLGMMPYVKGFNCIEHQVFYRTNNKLNTELIVKNF